MYITCELYVITSAMWFLNCCYMPIKLSEQSSKVNFIYIHEQNICHKELYNLYKIWLYDIYNMTSFRPLSLRRRDSLLQDIKTCKRCCTYRISRWLYYTDNIETENDNSKVQTYIPSIIVNRYRVAWGLEPMPADMGRKAGYRHILSILMHLLCVWADQMFLFTCGHPHALVWCSDFNLCFFLCILGYCICLHLKYLSRAVAVGRITKNTCNLSWRVASGHSFVLVGQNISH